MRQLVWLDLCSGLGGASQPALDRGWRVIRVDIDARFKPERRCDCGHTEREHEDSGDDETCDKCSCCDPRWLDNDTFIVADVRHLPLKPFHVDVLWASPPCTEFTKAGQPASWARGERKPATPESIEHATALVMAARMAVHDFRPRIWIIENVMNARKYLGLFLGPVRAVVAGHVLWGNYLGLFPQVHQERWLLPRTPDRAALRAKIPYEIGEAICAAVERRVEEG